MADKRGGELYFSTAQGPTFYLSVCLLIILNTVALILLTVISHGTGHNTDSLEYLFSVCSVVETLLLRFSWNSTSHNYQFIYHINRQDISLKFFIRSEIIYVCNRSSNSTTKIWYLFLDWVTFYLWSFLYFLWFIAIFTACFLLSISFLLLLICKLFTGLLWLFCHGHNFFFIPNVFRIFVTSSLLKLLNIISGQC